MPEASEAGKRLNSGCRLPSLDGMGALGGTDRMEFIKDKLRPMLILLGAVWAVEAVNLVLGHGLTVWGILPRSLGGIVGIPLAPFIHASFLHALSNTLPLLILGGLTLTAGERRFWSITVGIVVLSGLLVWLFARGAYHVGASGLIFGYFGALLARAFVERNVVSVIVATGVVVLYGGLIWGVLPTRSHISFEAHLFGLVAGIVVVWFGGRSERAGG